MSINGHVKIKMKRAKSEKIICDNSNAFTNGIADFLEKINQKELANTNISMMLTPSVSQTYSIRNSLPVTPMWKTLLGGILLFERPLTAGSSKYPSNNRLMALGNVENSRPDDDNNFYGNLESVEMLSNGVKETWIFPAGSINGSLASIALTYHAPSWGNPFGFDAAGRYVFGNCRYQYDAYLASGVGQTFYADEHGEYEAYGLNDKFYVKKKYSTIESPLPPYNNLFIGGRRLYKYAQSVTPENSTYKHDSYQYGIVYSSIDLASSKWPKAVYYGQDGYAYGISESNETGITYLKINISTMEITKHTVDYVSPYNPYGTALYDTRRACVYKGKMYLAVDHYNTNDFDVVQVDLDTGEEQTIFGGISDYVYDGGRGLFPYPTFGGVLFGCGIYLSIADNGIKGYNKLDYPPYPLIPVNDKFDFCITGEDRYPQQYRTAYWPRYFFYNPVYLGTVYNLPTPIAVTSEDEITVEYTLTAAS